MALSVAAYEKSAYVLVVRFFDETNSPVVPSSATWTLTDEFGAVINSREDVSITPLATIVNIALSGNDLAVTTAGKTAKRVITIHALYTSEAFGELPINDYAEFTVMSMVAIS